MNTPAHSCTPPPSSILKFGGSSVGTPKRIQNVAKIITGSAKNSQPPVVIVSAVQGITDLLINSAGSALTQKSRLVHQNLQKFAEIHRKIIENNLTPDLQDRAQKIIDSYIATLQNLYQGIYHLRDLSPRILDLIVSFGERLSSHLLAFTLLSQGQKAQRLSAANLIRTDDNYGAANIDFSTTRRLIIKHLSPVLNQKIIPVITGFFGASKNKNIVTLGRGGSDYSAAIIGISINAAEIQIWTDVDGIMTTDPRLLPHAHVVPTVSFQEAAELAYFGAKVLHPKTIQPAIEKNIPVRILNTFNSTNSGTLITAANIQSAKTVKAIAFQKNVTLINICSSRMLGQHGFLAKTFAVFEKYNVSVDVIATSEVSISLTIEDKDLKPILIKNLEKFATIRTLRDQALICIVGHGLKNDIQTESRIFQTLAKAKIPTELVSKGSSQINITMVIAKKHLEKAVTALHKTLLE